MFISQRHPQRLACKRRIVSVLHKGSRAGLFAALLIFCLFGDHRLVADDDPVDTTQFARVICVDSDGDGFGDPDVDSNTCPPDNCPEFYNPMQADYNGNGIGYPCDPEDCCGATNGGHPGNTNCDVEGKISLADITKLIDRVYISKSPLCCEADGNTDADPEGKINLADITREIAYVYNHIDFPPCM